MAHGASRREIRAVATDYSTVAPPITRRRLQGERRPVARGVHDQRHGAKSGEETNMASQDSDSIAGILRSLLSDTRALIRDELDLMRAEVREELMSARLAGVLLGGALLAAVLGAALLCVALGSGLSYWFGWPVWAGYGMVALLLLVGAFVAMTAGRKRLAKLGAFPKTRATMKENVSWIHSKSATR
jgi:hypothetical protein